ncbi:ribokinase [Aliiroseovarius crassostreae]|uniref:ribokinase n=1 Tax=Aliiroseovarius crassostreae TaxID=154981 RepID=UPI003C79B0E7
MTIFNFGSINIDNFYYLPRLPGPGETISTDRHTTALGGKGANQSIAVRRAGSDVRHIGAVGPDGAWCRDEMAQAGVDITHVMTRDVATGHANVCIDAHGENMIVLMPGANRYFDWAKVEGALDGLGPGDILILQNEVNLVRAAAEFAQTRGAKVIYSAAPFDADAVREVMPFCDLLVMNEVEAAQLADALGVTAEQIDVPEVLITKGSQGAVWRDQKTGDEIFVAAHQVTPVDTTGAGDCFLGNFAAGLDQGLDLTDALRRASAASAIQVTREGTASVMPTAEEVTAYLAAR